MMKRIVGMLVLLAACGRLDGAEPNHDASAPDGPIVISASDASVKTDAAPAVPDTVVVGEWYYDSGNYDRDNFLITAITFGEDGTFTMERVLVPVDPINQGFPGGVPTHRKSDDFGMYEVEGDTLTIRITKSRCVNQQAEFKLKATRTYFAESTNGTDRYATPVKNPADLARSNHLALDGDFLNIGGISKVSGNRYLFLADYVSRALDGGGRMPDYGCFEYDPTYDIEIVKARADPNYRCPLCAAWTWKFVPAELQDL